MYITLPPSQRTELWVADIDGSNKVRLATGESLSTGTWAPDNFFLSFWEARTGTGDQAYIVGADGRGLDQLPRTGDNVFNLVWSPDQKSVFVSGAEKGGTTPTVWKWSVEKTGIYVVSISERRCTLLLPGVGTGGVASARDGKSFL